VLLCIQEHFYMAADRFITDIEQGALHLLRKRFL
jgi:hypothetical protein